jgi:hypothetical protein
MNIWLFLTECPVARQQALLENWDEPRTWPAVPMLSPGF